MLRKTVLALLISLATGAAGTMTSQALPIAPPQTQVGNVGDTLQLAAYHRRVYRHAYHRHWAYSPRFGHRYHYRHGAYRFYYGGWWYPRPWWGVGYGYGYGYGGCRKVVHWHHHVKVVRRVCY